MMLKNKTIIMLILFCSLNAIKITIASSVIISNFTLSTLLYKFVLSGAIETTLIISLLRLKHVWPLASFYIIQSLYIVIILIYQSYFKGIFHLPSLLLIGELRNGITALQLKNCLNVIITMIDLPIFIVLIKNLNGLRKLISRKIVAVTAVLTFSLLIMIEVITLCRGNAIYGVNRYFISENQIVKHYGFFINEVVALVNSGNEKRTIQSIKYGNVSAFTNEKLRKPNIIVLQVESLGAGIENAQCENQQVAPFLDSLSKSTIYSPQLRSFHSTGGTTDCETSVLNSFEPSSVFPICKVSSYNYPNSVVKVLNTAGYSTLAFHGNIKNFFNRGITIGKMGFKKFYDINDMKLEQKGWGAPDSSVLMYAEQMARKETGPFFYYIITMTSHAPFTNVCNYADQDQYKSETNELTKRYYMSINYVDRVIETFINKMLELFPETYIVIFGDHTVDVSTDYLKRSFKLTNNEKIECVPLFIITPKKEIKNIQSNCSFLDLAPTIIDIAGIKCLYKSDGRSLVQ